MVQQRDGPRRLRDNDADDDESWSIKYCSGDPPVCLPVVQTWCILRLRLLQKLIQNSCWKSNPLVTVAIRPPEVAETGIESPLSGRCLAKVRLIVRVRV